MNPIFGAALDVQAFCLGHRWKFCFIGAVAVQRWGEPRLTLDVDLTVITGLGLEAAYVDALLTRFQGRRPDARDFALDNRVLLLQSAAGVPIDVALGTMDFEERAAFAGREKDWLDIEGIVQRQHGRLDERLIWSELTPLLELKEAPENTQRLRALLAAGNS